jgi:hypothetical protein
LTKVRTPSGFALIKFDDHNMAYAPEAGYMAEAGYDAYAQPAPPQSYGGGGGGVGAGGRPQGREPQYNDDGGYGMILTSPADL